MSKPNLTAVEKRISDEAKIIQQARARLQKLNAQKSKLSRLERTRRLILVGAVVVAKADRDKDFQAELLTWLDAGLDAERDRALFNLETKNEGTDATKTKTLQD